MHTHAHEKSRTSFVCWFFFFLQLCIVDHCDGKKAGSQKTATEPRSNKHSTRALINLISTTYGSSSIQCHSLRILIFQYTHLVRQALGRKERATMSSRNTGTFIIYTCLKAGSSEKLVCGRHRGREVLIANVGFHFTENKLGEMLAKIKHIFNVNIEHCLQ